MFIAQITNQTTQTVTETGIGLGSVIAVVCSWERNRSILWAILAGLFSWFYVIYLPPPAERTKPNESDPGVRLRAGRRAESWRDRQTTLPILCASSR